jgi:hypothetical protein
MTAVAIAGLVVVGFIIVMWVFRSGRSNTHRTM